MKRQIRRTLLRGSALDAVAAELLAYFDTAAPLQSTAAANTPETMSDALLQLPLPSELAAPRTEEIIWRTDADGAADKIMRELGQSDGQPLPTVSALTDAETPEPNAVRHTARLSASPGTQQTMDDISEFFRRDSRRYDNGFAGGNGI